MAVVQSGQGYLLFNAFDDCFVSCRLLKQYQLVLIYVMGVLLFKSMLMPVVWHMIVFLLLSVLPVT